MSLKVLLLNAGHNDLGLIKALNKMGAYIVTTGNRPNLIGQQYADEYIKADYSDKELITAMAEKLGVDAICPCCNDFGVMTAAYAAGRLNLPGHDTWLNVLNIHHKELFKQLAQSLGILTPAAASFTDYRRAAAYLDVHRDYPLIIKPVDLSAGNGITKITGPSEAQKALKKAFSASRKKAVVIEEYLEGEQQALCTFLKDRRVVACCSNNEYSFINPYRVEIDTFPASGIKGIRGFLIEEIERIAGALGLADGIFHVQYRLKDGKPYILEAMRRVLGNMYGIPALGVSGFDWDYWEARARCGLSCDGVPVRMEENGYYAYRAVMAPENGIVRDVHIPQEFSRYVYDQCMLWEKGLTVGNYMSEPLGFYFMKFDSREQMDEIMLQNYDKIFVTMEKR